LPILTLLLPINITPLIISSFPEENSYNYLSVRIAPANTSSIIKSITAIYRNVCPGTPLEYSFLNEELAQLYHDEDNFKVLFIYFSSLAIMISIIGLLGLTALLLSQKRKEIGIRRVVGASTISILKLQLKDFISLILISNIVAWPVVYYFMGKWLNDFAYRVGINWWMFIMAGGITLFITLTTVSMQAMKAITANPVEALKHE
jgi:putative ABC transport system permease protein